MAVVLIAVFFLQTLRLKPRHPTNLFIWPPGSPTKQQLSTESGAAAFDTGNIGPMLTAGVAPKNERLAQSQPFSENATERK
jgi:hypothetical protein